MSELTIKGRICEIDDQSKVKDNKRFIFLENGRFSEQVSLPETIVNTLKIGQEIELKVRNLSGVSSKGKPWQFYATL